MSAIPQTIPSVSYQTFPAPFFLGAGIILVLLGIVLFRRMGKRVRVPVLLLCLIAGAGFLSAVLISDNRKNRANETAKERSAEILTSTLAQTAYDFAGFFLEDDPMPVIDVHRTDVIGVLRIPSKEKELPVMGHWEDDWAKDAPCRYGGSAYDDTMIIGGYDIPAHFGELQKMQPGEEVSFTDVNGNVFRYIFLDFETVREDDPASLAAGSWDLTLFTGRGSSDERLVLRFAKDTGDVSF